MTGRIEGGNCIATVTFSADTPPKIATKPSDREIIAALVDAARQAKGALLLDAMLDEHGGPYGTTSVALDAIDAALKLAGA